MSAADDVTQRGVIAVGYDGSAQSSRAIDWAAHHAAQSGATVRIVACYGPPTDTEPWLATADGDIEVLCDAVLRMLERQVANSQLRHPHVEFVSEAVYGSPVDGLSAEAKESELVVVGAAGRGYFDAWRLGAVTAHLLAHARCPVAVIPNLARSAHHDRVVVGVDGSPASLDALDWATTEADRGDAELRVVHTWAYPYFTELVSTPGRELMEIDAAQVLEAAVRQARERCRTNIEGVLRDGPTVAELLEQATNADLIVVGSRGQGQHHSMMLGSVAYSVAARATCPTTVVHHPTS